MFRLEVLLKILRKIKKKSTIDRMITKTKSLRINYLAANHKYLSNPIKCKNAKKVYLTKILYHALKGKYKEPI